MESIGKRLVYFLEQEHISVKEFADEIGTHSNSIYRTISEDRGMNSSTLANIINSYPNLNINWLLTGNGTYKNSLGRDIVAEKHESYGENENLKDRVKEVLKNEVVLDVLVEILKRHDR